MFKNCPLHATAEEDGVVFPVTKCAFAATRPGEGGEYTVGGITVPVVSSIVLQGGLTRELELTEGLGSEHFQINVPPQDGASAIRRTLEPVPQEVLANVTEAEMNEFGWPQELRESYKAAQKHGWFGANKTKEIIEPAGADRDYVSEYNILVEEAEWPGIVANVQIQGVNKWLESVGGNCFIGSEADPIVQKLKSGESVSPLTGETMHGSTGLLQIARDARVVNLSGIRLVDNTYAVPGAEKCGGLTNEAYIDPVVNRAFGLPAPAGASKTELIGQLAGSASRAVEEQHGLEK
jgi:hypothetical protein